MMEYGIEVDRFSVISALTACSLVKSVKHGMRMGGSQLTLTVSGEKERK